MNGNHGHRDYLRGAAIPLQVTQAIGGPAKIANGPLVMVGASLSNAGGSGPTGIVSTAAFAAAGAGSASLAFSSASLSGFTVTMQPVAAAVHGTVTVSNVVNGPLLYDFEGIVGAQGTLDVRFPFPVQSTGGAATVSINAVVGGAAGNINVYGITVGTATATVTFTDGSGETVLVTSIGPGQTANPMTPDRGAMVTTELDITVAGSGPITGCVFTRQPDDYVREHEGWQEKSEPIPSPSQPVRP